jgi:hypothetical protein
VPGEPGDPRFERATRSRLSPVVDPRRRVSCIHGSSSQANRTTVDSGRHPTEETQHLGEVDDAGSVQDVVALQKRIDGDELPVVIDAQRVDHIEAGEISGQLRAAVERRVGSPRQRDDVGDI